MKRVLCIWLPNWPIQRLLVARPELRDRAVVLYARQGSRGQRVTACSSAASAVGVTPDMPLAEATTLLRKARSTRPGSASSAPAAGHSSSSAICFFHTETYDPSSDRAALTRLAEWCERFSPIIGLESSGDSSRGEPLEPSSLLLDITGLGPLFGGEESLAQRVVWQLREQGYEAHVTVADSVGAAWGAAHGAASGQASAISIIPPGEAAQALGPLPLQALRLAQATIAVFHQLGIQHVDQLLRLPRSSLTSRFGPDVLLRIDQALGNAREPLTAHHAPAIFTASWSLEYPTEQREVVELLIQQLIARVSHLLDEQNRGAVRLEIRLRCTKSPERDCESATRCEESTAGEGGTAGEESDPAGPRQRAAATPRKPAPRKPAEPDHPAAADAPAADTPTSRDLVFRLDLFRPTADADHLAELAKLQGEHTTWSAAIQEVTVHAPLTAPLEVHQGELFQGSARGAQQQLALLIDRLSSRLGRDGVLQPRLIAEAQPELACRYAPLSGRVPRSRESGPHLANCSWQATDRPLQLLHPPLPLQVLAAAPAGPPARFLWQHRWHTILRHGGPERIETGWWRGTTVRRDYYQVETEDGQRFWLFRQLTDGRWFLHGRFL